MWQIFGHDRLRLGPDSAPVAILTGLLVLVPGLAGVLPQLDPLWLSRSAAELVAVERAPGERIASSGYTEASLVFLLGTDTEFLAPDETASALARHHIALALVEKQGDAAFRTALASRSLAPHAFGQVQGLNYSNGKRLTLTLYRADPL